MRQKKTQIFVNLPRPEKSASRAGEKQILRKLSERKQSFSENCNFRKSSSRLGESSILKKKQVKLQKSSELRGWPFLKDVLANMKVFVKIAYKIRHFLGSKLRSKMDPKLKHFLSDFLGSFFGGHFWPEGQFSMDV